MKILGALVAALMQLPASAADTHCTAQEWNFLSCSTGKRVISVCLSKDLSATSGNLQYRFGPAGKPELALPEDPGVFRSTTTAGHLMFSGGGGFYLRFSQGPYVYIVYTGSGRGWGSREGVAVGKDGKRIASYPCKGHPTSDERGEDLLYSDKAGLTIDSSETASEMWDIVSTW